VSTDASLFPLHFWDSEIFCEKCEQIRKFKIFSQEKYDKNYSKSEIPLNTPLFCKCTHCENTMICATNEFAELKEDPTFGLCKIWGMGILEAGDWVYHPKEKLCVVDGVNRISGSLPQIVLKNKKNKKMEIQLESLPSGDHNIFYRLLPQDAPQALIGDNVYHTETKQIGIVAGLKFNGGQTIIIKLEDGTIERCHCEKESHYLTDEFVEKNVKWRCKDLSYSHNLQINSHSKVLYVNCLLPNFNAVCELEKIIYSIPQARCFIMHVIMEETDLRSEDLYKELLRKDIYICCNRIEFKNSEAYIAGFCKDRDTPQKIHKALQKFPIKKINLDIKMRPDIKNIKTINENDKFIKISKIGKKVHIDGWVKSEKEKKKANLKAFFSCFNFNIENHIWVIN